MQFSPDNVIFDECSLLIRGEILCAKVKIAIDMP